MWQIVKDLKVKLVVIWSQTGSTARIFSKHRFPIPIIALSAGIVLLGLAVAAPARHFAIFGLAVLGALQDIGAVVVARQRRPNGRAAGRERVVDRVEL